MKAIIVAGMKIPAIIKKLISERNLEIWDGFSIFHPLTAFFPMITGHYHNKLLSQQNAFMKKLLTIIVLVGLVSACRAPEPAVTPGEPRFAKVDAPTFYREATSRDGMVVSAHPLGSDAGRQMLEMGGNAVDAAVASAFAIAVLEPNMSGLGGSGAMTLWKPETGRADYIDFYAALGDDPDYAIDTDPDSLITRERGVAIPGMVDGLLQALEKYGTLERETVMAPAIKLAGEGFIVHHLLAHIFDTYSDRLAHDEEAAALFLPGGEPLRAGDRLVQPQLAEVLRKISEHGREGFYSGEVAERTIETLTEGNSVLTLEDFENYSANWRGTLCEKWNGRRILTAPPSLAGHEVILALKLLERSEMHRMGHPVTDGEALGTMVDAIRIARADRSKWHGDPSYVDLPVAGMISDDYASLRAAAMGGEVPDTMHAGNPWTASTRYTSPPACTGEGYFRLPLNIEPQHHDTLRQHIPENYIDEIEPEEYQHTTHISVVDGDGNAVSMTNTLGLYFGSAVFSDGVFYNSAATNFGGSYGSIRGPNRTAHSSTAPTIVLRDDRAELVAGSPGSGRIPPAIVSMIVYTLMFDLHPAEAIRMPRVYPSTSNRRVQLERGFSAEALKALNERGYVISPSNYPMNMYFGGVQMIRILEDGTMIGVSDPRRDGSPAGL